MFANFSSDLKLKGGLSSLDKENYEAEKENIILKFLNSNNKIKVLSKASS
jgi:hypothetical protein